MVKDIDFVADINEKYSPLDFELEQSLKQIAKTEQTLFVKDLEMCNEDVPKKHSPTIQSLDTARLRNYELLKSLEVSKARLRSRATFSPLETILQKAIGQYLKESSLAPCSTRKKYGPTYV